MCKASHEVTERFLRMLGLARKAGKTVLGTEVICEQMRAKKKPVLILVSSGASDGTLRRLSHKSSFYSIPCLTVDVAPEVLGHLLGTARPLVSVGITDGGFADQLRQECKYEKGFPGAGDDPFGGREFD